MRTIELVEEEDVLFESGRLREDEALEIHERFGDHIDVAFPTPLNGRRYCLRSKGYVGHLEITDRLRLRILPKTSIRNVFSMLEYAYDLPSFRLLEGATSLESVEELFETLALRLSKLTLDRTHRGLHREYIECEDELLLMRGRVDLAATLRNNARGSPRISCRFEEQTADIDDNRIIAWTLRSLSRYRFGNPEAQRSVRRAFRALSGDVALRSFKSHECLGRFYDRLNQDYRQIHLICRFFLEHLGPHQEGGGETFVPFLLSMPQLFESFVARWLDAHLPEDLRVRPQVGVWLDERGRYRFDIDLVLESADSGEVLAVLDTKYKRPDRMSSADLAQIVAYATSQGCRRGFLVYPGSVEEGVEVRAGEVRVESLSFDLSEEIGTSGRRFVVSLLGRIAAPEPSLREPGTGSPLGTRDAPGAA